MVRSRFMAQMEQLNTELIVMGTLCENALEKVANALDCAKTLWKKLQMRLITLLMKYRGISLF